MVTAVPCCYSSMLMQKTVQDLEKYADKDVARMHVSQSQSSI